MNPYNPTDEGYMKLSLRLARRGLGKTHPNPMVGAVLVKDGKVIGQGYHHYFGGAHAEIDAIKNAGGSVKGATLYVTMEPCSHYNKKTPPCVDALVRSGIARVVVGSLDPNPQVNGRGIGILKQHGIDTKAGVLEDQCRVLNEAHFKFMTTGLPLVTVKFAETIDGRIATAKGSSKWISSGESRKLAHRLRALNDAVMVGIGTVLADDPQLTVRLVKGRNPVRIIIDSKLRIPLEANILKSRESAPVIIATTSRADKTKQGALRDMGAEVLTVGANESGDVELKELLVKLGQRGIASLLVEGGSEVITSLLGLGLVDKLVVFIAPKIMGEGIEAVGDLHIDRVDKAIKLTYERIRRSGADLVIEAKVSK
ncbi:MAG: bifunctional diaminohydroxyphosphoribosylaminopyrimidine deaminase/5-amino-6-(5-phosphoribosylamino)uracil reductase RibD [Dehalococcoidales bacterium]|nr:bifunctional diaminohydroxyphosphoribosylaminopyrimidine deaminase/5-amino-6-(5-phosphoribosylamino)uracil reductase RibD [Dehalococcoidales bacterium]